MNQKEYLNEEKYNSTNQKVKKIGNILIIIGLILAGIGFILLIAGLLGFGGQISSGFENGQSGINASKIFSGFGKFAIGGFLIVPGSAIIFIGLIVRFLIGNRREIAAYTAQQVMPVTQEKIDTIAPTIGNAAKEISNGIKEGINEADRKE